jgi:hypothetical protein
MKFIDKHVDETIYIGLIAAVCLGLALWLMGTASKKDKFTVLLDENMTDEIVITPQEPIEIANIVEYEPLPEIVINDPILPRALPPLVEGGEVYFEEL